MRISTNIMALNAWRNLNNTSSMIAKNLERLSSGLRINRAADDAAGLTISELMRSQVRGLSQATRNAQDAISMIQTAEGALDQVHAILQRLRELAVQAASDTLTEDNRKEIQKEVRQLVDQVNLIANTTHFNTVRLLNGQRISQAATAARITGAAVTGPLTISDTPTSGYVQGAPLSGSAPKALPTYLTGASDLTQALNVTEDANELTLLVDGASYTISLTVTTHTSVADLLADINDQLQGAGVPVTASVDDQNHLVLTHDATGSAHTIEVTGGNAVQSLFGDPTSIEVSSGVDPDAVWLHGPTQAFTSGSVTITDASLRVDNLTIDDTSNTLQFHYTDDGVTWNEVTVTLDNQTYDGSNGKTRNDLKQDIQSKIDAQIGADRVRVGFDPDHTLRLTYVAGGAGSRIEVTGGTAVDRLFGAQETHLRQEALQANNVLSFDLDGTPVSVTLAEGYYSGADAVVEELNARFAQANVAATASDQAGALRITSQSTGSSSSVTNLGGSALQALNLQEALEVAGQDPNHILTIEVDGEQVQAAIPPGTYSDLATLAAILQNAINAASSTAADVTVQYAEAFTITSGSTGSTSTLSVTATGSDDASQTLGLTGQSGQGSDAVTGQITYQIGANAGESLALSISDMRSVALGLATLDPDEAGFDASNPILNGTRTEYVLSLTTRENAESAISRLDQAILQVSDERANLGAVQNRLEHTVSNLLIAAENLTAAESRIRDADMAREMMEFVRQQILMQSGTAMLAQANLVPQSVLQLLG